MNRIINTAIHDVVETLTREEKELFDFDEELRAHEQGGTEAASAPQAEAPRARQQSRTATDSGGAASSAAGKRAQAGGSTTGGRGSAQPKGSRKPGERDYAHYLSILGLPLAASDDDVHRAYRRLMRQSHPDKVATLSPALQKQATERAMRISEAYQILRRRRGFK